MKISIKINPEYDKQAQSIKDYGQLSLILDVLSFTNNTNTSIHFWLRLDDY